MTPPPCRWCRRPFADVTACTAPEAAHTAPHHGHLWDEVELDELVRNFEDYRDRALPCRDCLVEPLSQHHPGCCVALCYVTGEEEQALCCDCPKCDPVNEVLDQIRAASEN